MKLIIIGYNCGKTELLKVAIARLQSKIVVAEVLKGFEIVAHKPLEYKFEIFLKRERTYPTLKEGLRKNIIKKIK